MATSTKPKGAPKARSSTKQEARSDAERWGGRQGVNRNPDSETLHANISEWVRLLLKASGIKQWQLAEALGIDEGALSRSLSTTTSRPRAWQVPELKVLAVTFNRPIDDFYKSPDLTETQLREADYV